MKRLLSAVLIMAMVVVEAIAKPEITTDVGLDYNLGVGNPVWARGVGISSTMRFYLNDNFSIGPTLGISKWTAKDDAFSISASLLPGVSATASTTIDGDVLAIPIGCSVAYRHGFGKNLIGLAEGGLKYVIVQSDITASGNASVSVGPFTIGGSTAAYDVEVGNNVLFFLAGEILMPIKETFGLYAKAGYQIDLKKGECSVNGTDVEVQNELKSLYLGIGAYFTF